METLLKDVENAQGIPLANALGEPGSNLEISDDGIWFNGVGDDAAEIFCLNRKRPPKNPCERRGWDFCKTYRRPYDLAVTAALCYLCTVPDPAAFTAGSDGHGKDFLEGLAEARRALPRYANILDIPMEILQNDRWCSPWVSATPAGFAVHFCVDGQGYVGDLVKDEWCCFETHLALAQWLHDNRMAAFKTRIRVRFASQVFDEGNVESNIWNATGSFDEARHARIAKAQHAAIKTLFPVVAPCTTQRPPAYVRPGEMPEVATRAYYFEDLLKELSK
jgi:hypothetical protein